MAQGRKAPKNQRSLEAITADIYKSEQQNVLTTGRLLLEAKEQAGHGKWLPYLKSIGWSPRTAQLHISVAELAAKYETVAHLNAAPTALYHLVWLSEHGEESVSKSVPVAIERLAKSAAHGDSASQQWETVNLAPFAMTHPKATELALKAASEAINLTCFGDSKRYAAMMEQGREIIKANPKTEEELAAVQAKHPIPLPAGMSAEAFDQLSRTGRVIVEDDEDDTDEEEAEKAEPAADLPPRQLAMVGKFDDACGELLKLSSRASAVFTRSELSAGDLDMLGNFLKQIAASKRKKAA